MGADAARAQAGLDKRREKGAPPGRPAQDKTLIRAPTGPAPHLARLPSIEQRRTAAGADWVFNPNDRSHRSQRAPRPRPQPTQPNPNRRDSSAFEGGGAGRFATPAKGVAKRPGCSLRKDPQRQQTLNELSPPRGPTQSAGWVKRKRASMPSGRPRKDRPWQPARGWAPKGRGRHASRRKTKKMGRSRKKSGETKPKISGEKIECAQLDVNSAGFGAKPRQAADWETGAAWRADKRRYAKNEKDTGFWPPPWRRVGREGRLGDRSRVRLVRRLPGAIPVF